MASDLQLRCRCGVVRGVAHGVSPAAGFRFTCYCDDCQAFARFLERPDVLDGAGGTDIFHTAPRYVELTSGATSLRCVSISGQVLRWYADCCRTPIANTASSPRFPVVALIHAFIADPVEGPSRDGVLGPRLCRIFEHSATGPLPPDAPPPFSAGLWFRRSVKLLSWWARGYGRPNPFFDGRTRVPVSEPQPLNLSSP